MAQLVESSPVTGSRAVSINSSCFPPPLLEISSLPSGFPSHLQSSLAWTGNQFSRDTDYVLRLTVEDVVEIEQAVQRFKALGLDGDLVSRDSFHLPSVGPRLQYLRTDIHYGKGFGVIRGIDPGNYSVEDLTIIYLGLQSHIADQHGRQDSKGNMLVHIVADDSSTARSTHHRHSTTSITFHNEEAGDVVSWLTRNTAASGGKCIISSAYTTYNVLAASRPDLIRTLARSDWPFAMPHFHCRPVLFYEDGRLITNFGRAALLGSACHPRPNHLPKLTSGQIEALDAIESISKATQLEISTEPGDMHFINNLAILHRREGYANGSSPTTKRHLVRMILRDGALGWSIPPALQHEWDKAFNSTRSRVWHLEPMPHGFFPLRSQPN